MSKYQVTTDGGTYEIETDDTPTAPQWSDIPDNVVQGLKEAPQTALGMADQVVKGQDLTNPASYVNSAVQALQGTDLSDTPTGQAFGAVKDGIGSTMSGLQNLATHPINTIKNQIIQHPISTAVMAASAPLAATGLGEDALGTAGQYAGRFGEDQAFKALGRRLPGMTAEDMRSMGRNANDMGLLDHDMGPMGRKETVDAMNSQAGMDIGDIRQQAAANGPIRTGQQMADAIRERLGDEYKPGGTNYDQTGALERELQNIQQMPSTDPSDFAERASDMYSKAKGKGYAVPTNVDTDVAGNLAHINDEDIAGALPDQADQYGMLKQTFGDTADMQKVIERGEQRSIGRPGSHTMLEAGGKFLDELGAHKIGAKTGFAAESALNGASQAIRPIGIAGITSSIMSKIQTDPQSLGRYAAPLMQAAQGGPQGIAATHYVLSLQHPDYNKMWQDTSGSGNQ